MAMSGERAGPERIRQGESLSVAGVGVLEVDRITMRDDLAEQSQTPGFVTAFPMPSSQRQGLLGMGQSLVESFLEQTGFAEPPELHGPAHAHGAHGRRALYHIGEETAGFRRPLREHVRVTETGKHSPGLQMPFDDEDARTLQRREGLLEISLGE